MFNDAIDQMNALAAEGAGKDQYDTLFRSSMSTLVRQLNLSADNLTHLKELSREKLMADIEETNSIISGIRELNTAIRKCSIYGDNALEQRDQRNVLLDNLSKYMAIEVEYGQEEIGPGLTVEKLMVRTDTEPKRMLIDGRYTTEVLLRDGADEGDDPNFDIDLAQLTDIHGRTMALEENDMGVVKNRDVGAVEDTDGTVIHYRNLKEAEEAAAEMNKTAVGTEFHAETEEDALRFTNTAPPSTPVPRTPPRRWPKSRKTITSTSIHWAKSPAMTCAFWTAAASLKFTSSRYSGARCRRSTPNWAERFWPTANS